VDIFIDFSIFPYHMYNKNMELYKKIVDKILDSLEKTSWWKFGRIWYLKHQLEIYQHLINNITKERIKKENDNT